MSISSLIKWHTKRQYLVSALSIRSLKLRLPLSKMSILERQFLAALGARKLVKRTRLQFRTFLLLQRYGYLHVGVSIMFLVDNR